MHNDILTPLIERSISFLQDDLNINVITDKIEVIHTAKIDLKKNTAMIGTGGSIQVLITIGYDDNLLEKIVLAFLEGEEPVEAEKEELYESVSCEFVNIIVGNALHNPVDETTLSITPPILINEAKSLSKHKNSKISIATIQTVFGDMLLTIIEPKDKFVKELNFKEL